MFIESPTPSKTLIGEEEGENLRTPQSEELERVLARTSKLSSSVRERPKMFSIPLEMASDSWRTFNWVVSGSSASLVRASSLGTLSAALLTISPAGF